MGYVVAKYIRLSVEDSKTDSLSIENQRLMLGGFIAANFKNAEILELVDNGYSGINYDRPGVRKLLEFVRNGSVNCICVKDFSRLGRDSIETGYYVEQLFPSLGVRVIALSDGYDSDEHKAGAGIDVMFKFLVNELYSRDISKKIRSAKAAKMGTGEYYSRVPLGYVRSGRTLQIDEPGAETVREIIRKRLEGEGIAQIARSAELSTAKVRTILRDERYTGVYVAGKTEMLDVGCKKQRKKPESEWVRIPNHHPAIVDTAVFEAARRVG